MTRDLDAAAVKQKIAELLRQPPARVADDATPLLDLVPGSFALVELVIRLQEELGIRLTQDDLRAVTRVGDLVAVVRAAAAAGA